MICRLCLIDLNSKICVPIFNDFGNNDEPELVKIISKYLHIDITSADEISTAICHECSKHLKEFDKYCACVRKQQILLSQGVLVGQENAEKFIDATLSVEPMEVQVKCESAGLTMETQLKCEPEETVLTEMAVISGAGSNYPTSSGYSYLSRGLQTKMCNFSQGNAYKIMDATLSIEPMEVQVKCESEDLTMEALFKCEPEETVVTEMELISGLVRTSSSYSDPSSSSFLHEANTSGSAQIVNPQNIDDSSSSLDNHVHTLPDANTIRLLQPLQKIYKNYSMGNSLKDKDRIQISKAVIDKCLKDAPAKLLHREEFEKLAESIKEVFPSEFVSMYYIPSIRHQQASGKLYNAYNNKINTLKTSGGINTQSKACVSTDVALVDVSPPKRQKHPDLHKRVIAKENVERGKEHKTASGNVVPAKLFQVQEICRCGKNCCKKIDVCRQKEIFESYYSGSWTQKTLILRSLIKKKNVSSSISKYSPIISLKKKKVSYEYSFIDDEGTSQKVCRDFFMKCLNVTPNRIQNAVKSLLANPNAIEKRGSASSINKTSEEDRLNVISFINLFPKYESHYSRSASQKKYLHPNLNLMKLYKEYKSSCDFKHQNIVSSSIFTSIFKSSFNLSFKQRNSDACKTCYSFECTLKGDLTKEEKIDIENRKDKHMTLVEKTITEFKEDVKQAIESHKSVLTFDLQKTLETPSLTTSEAYYKRQLWTYNLCIFDEVEKRGYMYVWNESVASRGCREIGSCLLFHLQNNIPSSTRDIILYSDSCGGQNRNIKIALLLHHFLLSSKFNSIEQKFFISGHSYNSCDRCFSLIERKKQLHEIVATPDDWLEIIKTSKKTEPIFSVKKMNAENFFFSSNLEELIINCKKDITGEEVNWFLLLKIYQSKKKVFELAFCNEQSTQIVNFGKINISFKDFQSISLELLYPLGRKITKSKFTDLMQLKMYIPAESRNFYDELKFEELSNIDYGIASDVSDVSDVED